MDQGIFFLFLRRLSAATEALRGETHGSLCPKGAVADRLWIPLSWKGFSSLRMAVLNLNGVDFAASLVDYII